MITRSMVEQGFDKGYIRLVNDFGHGIMAKIGEYRFWFGGTMAEHYFDVDCYLSDVGRCNVLDKIYEALESFRKDKDFLEEYKYYELYLKERLIRKNRELRQSKEISQKLLDAINILGIDHKQIAEMIATYGHRELQSEFAFICMYYLMTISDKDYQYDDRNRIVHQLAQRFVNPDFEF